ncbi:ANTAR domain-containing protein [Arsenicicoccus sp. oral taxon 190]|uniref:ANTAR domain-containing protein n=1 Tax=Arsenicicoccus sp. oral taxon 190 TaxID=1658671 RepID=UPI00067BFBC1|nr:ANTAR domain-containing protein [Arsenicicoccus sp. oral taxon 190]
MTNPSPTPTTAWWRVGVRGPSDLRWSLSPEVYQLLGAEPDGQLQGLDLLLSSFDASEVQLAEDAGDALHRGRAFAHRRRVLRHGEGLEVFVVGVGDYSEDGTLTAVSGVFLDVRALLHETVSAEVTHQLREVVEARGVIEQAKGILMVAYGITAEDAFELLGWYSQRTNTRVRVIADRLAAAASTRPAVASQLDTYLSALLDPRSAETLLPVRDGHAAWGPDLRTPTVESRRVDGHVLISLAGDVDVARARTVVPQLRDALAAVARPSRPHALDLSQAGYVSPTALTAIASLVGRHVQGEAEIRVLPGALGDALVAAGVPRSCLVTM